MILENSNLKSIVDAIASQFPDVHEDIILIEILVKLGQIATLNRLQVKSVEAETFCNIYTILFAKSGMGKDKPIKFIDNNLVTEFKTKFYNQSELFYRDFQNKIEQEAEEKFDTKIQKNSFIRDNLPRTLVDSFSNGTLEGLLSQRLAFQKAGFGGTFLMISEFGDYITSNNNSRMEFLSTITEIFDDGNNLGKIIKGDNESYEVKGVPSVAHFHTSPSGLLEGSNSEKLKDFLNRGLARRAFIAFPDKKEIEDSKNIEEKYEEYLKLKNSNTAYLVKQLFTDFVNSPISTYEFTEEANFELFKYMTKKRKEADKMKEEPEAIVAEARNRHWKALKLSGLIAKLEHPSDNSVYSKDLEVAISITEHFGSQLKKFYLTKEDDASMQLYKYFIQNLGKGLSTMELRGQKIVPDAQFTRWLFEVLPDLKTHAKRNGYDLKIKNGEGNSKIYKMIDLNQQKIKKNIKKIKNDSLKQIFENND